MDIAPAHHIQPDHISPVFTDGTTTRFVLEAAEPATDETTGGDPTCVARLPTVVGDVGETVVVGVVTVVGVAAVVGVVTVVGETVVVGVVTVVGVAAAQLGAVTLAACSVTSPFRAKRRPSTDAPVSAVILVNASTVPTNEELVPSVTLLVTCQNTLQACAPFVSTIALDDAVVREEPAWKTKTAPSLPPPLRVKAPVMPIVELEL
jgi:hypothetical protein